MATGLHKEFVWPKNNRITGARSDKAIKEVLNIVRMGHVRTQLCVIFYFDQPDAEVDLLVPGERYLITYKTPDNIAFTWKGKVAEADSLKTINRALKLAGYEHLSAEAYYITTTKDGQMLQHSTGEEMIFPGRTYYLRLM